MLITSHPPVLSLHPMRLDPPTSTGGAGPAQTSGARRPRAGAIVPGRWSPAAPDDRSALADRALRRLRYARQR